MSQHRKKPTIRLRTSEDSDHPAHPHSLMRVFADGMFLLQPPKIKENFHTGWIYLGNLGVILICVCEPVFQNLPHSYTWPLKKRTHSYTSSSKILTYSYTALWFFVPIFAGCYTNITVNSCNTKRISSLKKSNLWAKNTCIYQDVRKMGPFT